MRVADGNVLAKVPTADAEAVWWTDDGRVAVPRLGEVVYLDLSGSVTARIGFSGRLANVAVMLGRE